MASIALASACIAGVTAVANIGSAYSQYRTNHPRTNNTGRVDNYTATHEGYSMTYPLHPEQVTLYQNYLYVVQTPQPNYADQFSIPAHTPPPHQYQLPPPPPPSNSPSIPAYPPPPHQYQHPPPPPHQYQQPPPPPPSNSPSIPAYPPPPHQYQHPPPPPHQHQQPPPPPPPPRSPSFSERYLPNSTNLVRRLLGRTNTASSQVPGHVENHYLRPNPAPVHDTEYSHHDPDRPSPQVPDHAENHYLRSNTGRAHDTQCSHHDPGRPSQGYVVLSREQQAWDTWPDSNIGMRTGRMPGYNEGMGRAHWSHFQNNYHNVAGGTIAVVNWSEKSIAMYVYSEHWREYFLNYQVHDYDPEALGRSFSNYQVFSGILKDSWLVGCNDDLKVVEDDRYCDVKSSNCWGLLGIQGHIPGDLVFVEMKRAALFGIIQCRSKDPTLLNVDMVGDQRVQFVHVDTQYKDLETKENCWFSVFSFNDNGWAAERVLVG